MSSAEEEKARKFGAICSILQDIEFEKIRECYNHKCSDLEKGMVYKDATRYFCGAEYEIFKKCNSRIFQFVNGGDSEK